MPTEVEPADVVQDRFWRGLDDDHVVHEGPLAEREDAIAAGGDGGVVSRDEDRRAAAVSQLEEDP